jgi:hypothetical protein
LVLGTGAVIGGEFISRIEISNLEFVFLPSSYSSAINMVTLVGVTLGLIISEMELKRFRLSTLFFLTPLVYGSPKVFSKLLKALGVLDYGWLEPYFLIKKKVY